MKKSTLLLAALLIMCSQTKFADFADIDQDLPLHAIVKNQDYSLQQKLEMIADLVQNGKIDINAGDADGKTALNLLTELKGDPLIAALLLRLGAKVDEPDLFNNTPLLKTLSSDQIATAALLLHHGADTSFQNDMGQNAYDVARSQATQQVLENQEQRDATKNSERD